MQINVEYQQQFKSRLINSAAFFYLKINKIELEVPKNQRAMYNKYTSPKINVG